MNRRHIGTVFNVEENAAGPSTSSSQSDIYSLGSKDPLTGPDNNIRVTSQQGLQPQDHDDEISVRGGFSRSSNMRRWSQNLLKTNNINSGKKTMRQRTINFMPSRNRLISSDGHISTSLQDSKVEQLAQEIEQHDHLMEDSAFGEQLRIATLKALPQSLTIKRQIRTMLSTSVTSNSNSKNIGRWKRFKYSLATANSRTKSSMKNTLSNVELWYNSMKTIEGHFGSGVATYFKFLRWLFTLNLALFIITMAFIAIPQILFNNFVAVEETSIVETSLNNTKQEALRTDEYFKPMDLLTAEGYFQRTILFYGAYSNQSFGLNKPNEYSLPHAYFLTMLCSYIAIFIIISSSMARSYRRSFIETSGGIQNMYAHKIFCSWDFGISNRRAAVLKHHSIYNDLKEILHDMLRDHIKKKPLQKFWSVAAQMSAHILVFGMLAGLGVAMWTLLQNFGDQTDLASWTALYLSICVNMTMLVLQMFFSWLAKMEDYKSPRVTLHVTLMRIYLLEVVVIGVLLVFWLTRKVTGCWETSIGQEVYRLVIIDFLLIEVGGAIVQGIRYLLYCKCSRKIGQSEFDISRATLGLVFNQTLLWVGLVFSPLLAAVVTIKIILTFYLKKTTLINFCKPPSKLWRSAQTQTVYLVMAFLSLLGVVIAHGWIITQVTVSQQCGPFRGHNFMFQILVEGILKLREGHWIWRVVTVILRPAVMGGLLLTMAVIVYYLRSKSKSRITMVKLLKEMLYMEAKDKEFLLSQITQITQDKEWLFEEDDSVFNEGGRTRQDNFAESSSTWQYKAEPRTSGIEDIRQRRF